jgi:hypothetical protein
VVDRGLHPSWYGHRSHVARFADQIDDGPMVLPSLNSTDIQGNDLRMPETTPEK